MTAETVLTVIVTGLVIGLLGRLLAPGRQRIGILLTIGVGIVGALIGAWVGAELNATSLLVVVVLQVLAAALLVSAFSRTSRA